MLVGAGLPKPQTQIVVQNNWGAVLARIDMGWEKWRVGVEYDGAQHWTDPRIRANDIDRIAELERRGWRIIRVSSELLRHRPDIVLARVREALRAVAAARSRPLRFARALDLGCGTGLVAQALHADCDAIVGVDLSHAMAAAARRILGDAVGERSIVQIVATAEQLGGD